MELAQGGSNMRARVNLLAGVQVHHLSQAAGCVMYPRRWLLQMERHLAGANVFSGWEAVGRGGQDAEICIFR